MENQDNKKKRHVILTIYYVLAIVLTSFNFFGGLPLLSNPVVVGKIKIIAVILILACALKIVGDVLILCWKKLGAYLGMCGLALNFAAIMGISAQPQLEAGNGVFTAIIGTIIWFVALSFVWDGLKSFKK